MTRDGYVFGPENCMCCIIVVLMHDISLVPIKKKNYLQCVKADGGGLLGTPILCTPRGWEEFKRFFFFGRQRVGGV